MKCRGLTTLDIFLDTYIRGFQIICNITRLNNVRIFNSWVSLPTEYSNFNVQRNYFTVLNFNHAACDVGAGPFVVVPLNFTRKLT